MIIMRKHIRREHSNSIHKIIRDYDEFWKVEIISYEHELTEVYTPSLSNMNGTNITTKSYKSWSAIASSDEKNPFTLKLNYSVQSSGEYRIDILYENIAEHKLSGEYKGTAVPFDGSVNDVKLTTFFEEWSKGSQSFEIEIPIHTYIYGVIIRKTKEYTFESVKFTNNMVVPEVDTTDSSQLDPVECSFEVLLDDAFECDISPSGYYMSYNDEVNVYVKAKDGADEVQIFGGYLSTILPNDDRTRLNISCADRLVDGQNKYILSQMTLLGGTKSKDEKEYVSYMDKDFKSYGEALKFLCSAMQTTLKNNIGKNYLVDNETAKKGFNIEFGKKKTISKVTCTNATAKMSKNFVTLRNNSSAQKKQTIILYDGKKSRGSKPPINITNYSNFSVVYGLGEPKKSHKEKSTEIVEVGSGNAGSQEFNKCGVSKDGKYLMAIGLPSACGEVSKYGYTYYKRIYVRKCVCGSTNLVWDWHWVGTSNYGYSPCRGNSEGGSAEGHIFCKSCDRDYSIITGKDHHHCGSKNKLKPASSIMKSSASEAQKLKAGNMVATPTGDSLSADDIFKAIWELAKSKKFKYQLKGNTTSTASGLESTRVGDCWAFSEWIFNQLKAYKVNCRVLDYKSSESDNHRSVQYQNKNNKWVNFPYSDYGWNKKLRPDSGINHPNSTPFKYTAGGNIASAKSKSGTKTQTTTVTVTTGYDKDKPFQGYFEVVVSAKAKGSKGSFKDKTKSFYVGFTLKSDAINALTGFSPVWINNTTRKLNVDLLKFIKSVYNDYDDKYSYFLHSIKLITPKNKEDWYKNDNSTRDEASCKIDLYSINFNDETLINPTDLDSCGKNITSIMQDLVSASHYTVNKQYSKHRKDDTINFSVDNQTEPKLVVEEGDNSNVLSISGISYTPRSNLFNDSIVVFKNGKNKYQYVETKDVESILKYGVQTTLQTSSEVMGSKEAYYNAINNTNYNPVETFSFTVTLPYFVDIKVGDIVQVIAFSRKLNTVKTVASVKYKIRNDDIPKIQTEIGVGELPMDLQIAKELREIRASAKKETTSFSSSAEPLLDDEVYEWDN